ncbi:MAG: helix-turn-helix domain-containing protein [Lachnospiraceae bacterium]|nr:helix-turn-helix domain-containing protein [Lachnospiraceae bacterium]
MSYLLVLTPAIITGIVLYQKTLAADLKQAGRLNQTLAEVAAGEIDNQVNQVNICLNKIALDSNVHILSNAKGSFRAEEQYYLYILHNTIKNIHLLEQYCDDIFIYFKNTDTILGVNGVMPYALYDNLYNKEGQYNAGEMRRYLSQFHYQDILSFYTEEGEYLLFTMTSLRLGAGEPTATVGVRMKREFLSRLFENVRWDESVQMVITGKNGQIITAAAEAENEKNSYITTEITSSQSGWNYVLMVPRTLVEQNAIQIRRRGVNGLFISIVIGSFLSYIFSSVNYHSLRAVVDRLKGPKIIENEYQWLNSRTEQLFTELKNTKKNLKESEEQLKQFHLLQLLEYPCGFPKQEIASYHINPEAAFHVVLLIAVEYEKPLREDSELSIHENTLRRFITANIFGEMLEREYACELLQLKEQVAVIANLSESSEVVKLEAVAREAGQMIEEKFGFGVMAFLGKPGSGVGGIHTSYLHARKCLNGYLGGQKSEGWKHEGLIEEIEAYIDENYPNPDLNVAMLGQHFHITSAYLASLYKKQRGKSPLDYINDARILKAEELISQGASVATAAKETGFRDSGAFIRVFKKKRGITPGQMKLISKE